MTEEISDPLEYIERIRKVQREVAEKRQTQKEAREKKLCNDVLLLCMKAAQDGDPCFIARTQFTSEEIEVVRARIGVRLYTKPGAATGYLYAFHLPEKQPEG